MADSIVVDRFQPFPSRSDEVIRLQFKYDQAITEAIKECLKPLHKRVRDPSRNIANAGGWLVQHRAWFIEFAAWPSVRHMLIEMGLVLDEPDSFIDEVRVMRYLAFGGNHQEAHGGWCDLMDQFDREHDSLQSAIQQSCEIALKSGFDWLHIVDLDSRQIVFQAG